MNRKFKLIEHPADIGIEVFGKTIEELFKNSSYALFKIMDISIGEKQEKTIKFSLSADTLEELLVRFLNELIYIAQVKNKYGKVDIKLTKKQNTYELKCFLQGNCIKKIGREIKSTTYHNLEIKKEREFYKCSIIFDL